MVDQDMNEVPMAPQASQMFYPLSLGLGREGDQMSLTFRLDGRIDGDIENARRILGRMGAQQTGPTALMLTFLPALLLQEELYRQLYDRSGPQPKVRTT